MHSRLPPRRDALVIPLVRNDTSYGQNNVMMYCTLDALYNPDRGGHLSCPHSLARIASFASSRPIPLELDSDPES